MTAISDQIRRLPGQMYVVEARYAVGGFIREFWHWIDTDFWLRDEYARADLWRRVENLTR